METKNTAIDNLILFAKTSKDIVEFSMKVMVYADENNQTNLLSLAKSIYLYLMECNVKLVVNPSEGVYEVVGGGDINDYVGGIDKALQKGLGIFTPKLNMMLLSSDIETIESSVVKGYGIDAYLMQQNFMMAFIAIYLHESIHAIIFNQGNSNSPNIPEISSLKTLISKAAKFGDLFYLKAASDYWEEMITHIVSSKNYYNYIVENNLSFELSKIISKVIPDERVRIDLINIINEWTKIFYGVNYDVIYQIPNYSNTKNFLSRNFFTENPARILGAELESTNRWGKFVYKTKRFESDHSIDDILGRVKDIPIIDFDSFDNLAKTDQYDTSFEIEQAIESVSKSIEQRKSQPAKGDIPDLISFAESVRIYNTEGEYNHLSWLEIEAYLYCNPGENKLIWREGALEYSEEQIMASMSGITLNKQMDNECEITIPTVIFDGENNNYFATFLHGDVFQKTVDIKANRDLIIEKRGEAYYESLVSGLDSIRFVNVSFDNEDFSARPYISPVSDTSKNFKITSFVGDSRTYNTDPLPLIEAFMICIGSRDQVWYKSSRYNGVTSHEVVKVMEGKRLIERPFRGSKLNEMEKAANEDADNKNSIKFDHIFEQACICFSDFIRECVDEESKKRLEEEISGFYNKFCFTELEKIPIGFTHSSRFKRSKFKLKSIQKNSIAFVNINKTGLLAHEVGVGKGHPLTEPILTPLGYVSMGSVKVGDELIRKNGRYTKITDIFPLGLTKCFKVTFSDGSSTEVTDEHLWNVQTFNYRDKYPWKWDTMRTIDMIDTLHNGRGNCRYSIPMVEPVEFVQQDIPIDPYLLGVLLGDGSFTTGSIGLMNTELDIIERVKSALPESVELKYTTEENEYRLSRRAISGKNELIDSLRVLGLYNKLSYEKSIPDIYKYNIPEVRIEILRGLIDTDGWIHKSKNRKKGCSVFFTTSSEKLCNDVVFLVNSFGGTCTIKTKIPKYTYNGEKRVGRLAYSVSVRMPESIIPVSSKKHLKKFEVKTKYIPVRFIQSIEEIGMKEAQCIKVDADDQLYVCKDFIVTHNTTSALMSVSYAFDTNRANKALIVVPPQVYEKWINECRNHKEKITDPITKEVKEIDIYGSLPHLNVVGLSNLSNKVLLELKDYSANDKKRIEKAAAGWVEFNNQLKKELKNIEVVEDEEEDDAEVVFSDKEGSEKEEKSKLPVLLPAGYPNVASLFDRLVQYVEIDVLESFGVTNETNKNYTVLSSILSSQFQNGTVSSVVKDLFVEAIPKKDVKNYRYFYEIPETIVVSVLLSYIFKNYKNLESNLVIRLGTFREFPDKTIFFTTYPGLSRFGFKDETVEIMSTKLYGILKGGAEGADEEKIKKNIETILLKSELNAKVYFEDLGFDYIVIDEAHRLKNLLTSVTTEDDKRDLYPGNKAQIMTVKGGTQSQVALTGFMATMYVQMKTGGKNTLLLTATPFTNSPLEIFSMLTLTSYNYLERLGYDNVLKFAQDFIRIKSQLSITVDGSVKTKIEPVGYNNLQLLRRVIYTLIDFRSAEESNISRPCKIVLPIMEKSTLCESHKAEGFKVVKPVSTIVIPTRQQQLIFDALQYYLSSQINKETVDQRFLGFILKQGGEYYKKVSFSDMDIEYSEYMMSVTDLAQKIKNRFNILKDGRFVDKLMPATAILKTLMAMRNVSISPYMFRPYVTDYLGITDEDIDPYQVVEQSSKLMLVLSCIKKANIYQKSLSKDLKGFVIYSNLGTKPGKNSPISLLKIIKQYLLDEDKGFGYKSKCVEYEGFRTKFDEVEILADSTASNPKKRVALMNLYNQGKIKVIITTVKEGVDLNGDTICLFNLSVDWNPTDAKQIEGRAWRQGNKNAYIIISYPLTANGSDMAIYQKLQDKTLRLKALWDKSSSLKSAFDLDEFDPEALKMEMISRVEKLAPFIFNEETTAERYKYDMLKSKKVEDELVIKNYREFQSKETQLRYAMMLFSRLPVILARENKLKELKDKIRLSEDAVVRYEKTIADEKFSIPEYQELQALQSKVSDAQLSIKVKAGEFGVLLSDDKNDEAAIIKKEIDSIKIQAKKLEAEVDKMKKIVNEKAAESVKEFEDELKKEQKELAKLKKSLEVKDEEPIILYEPTKKVEFALNDPNHGNFFIKSESGGIIYKEKGLSLDRIDWLNLASIYDLLEGVKRIVETYININSTYSVSINDYEDDYIDLGVINDEFKILPEEYLINLTQKYLGGYSNSIYKSKIFGLLRDFYSRGYTQEYWNLFRVNMLIATINRSLRDYRSILEDKDPDEYLQELDEQLNLLYEKMGATEDIMKIPDSVFEDYIEKAYKVISKRRKEYSNYINLVDGFMGFADLFNTELESVLIDQNVQKELADVATIEYTEEVKDKKEAENIVQVYADKIEVYRDMIAESESEEQKQAYIDKIEVYQEMINELK